jgi:membrane protein DedA with SNARE-associated domain
METILEFVKNWGYVAVFLGALVEGESIILAASALAFAGYLNIYYVGIVAFFSTTFAEQTCYMIGRYYGVAIFEKFPRLKAKSEKAFILLKKIDVFFILICRFIYGIRTVSPFVVGASGIPPKKFIPLNILAATIWSVVSCWAGYELGEVIINNFESIKKFIERIFIWIPVIILLIGLIIFYVKKIIKKRKTLL